MRPILVALLIAGVLLSELRFDWIERNVGAYLVTTNSERPESGAIWDVGHRNLTAQRTLEKIITDRLETQREVSEAATLKQVGRYYPEQHGRGHVVTGPFSNPVPGPAAFRFPEHSVSV